MPKKIVRKTALNTKYSRRSSDGSVNFTFFKSKMFLTLLAIALVVIVFAVLSSMNNPYPTSEMNVDSQYRIDTTNLKLDPNAKNVITP